MRYKLTVKHSVKLLEKILDIFCENAQLSLEGDLSQCDFTDLTLLVNESRSEITFPQNDHNRYVIIELNNSTIGKIKKQILPKAGIRSRIYHLVIKKNDQMVFASYDNFEKDDVWVSDEITCDILDNWIDLKVLRSYQAIPD